MEGTLPEDEAGAVRGGGERPRVLFLIHDLGPGGAERAFLAYVNGLQAVEAVPVVVRPRLAWAGKLAPGTPLYDLELPVPADRPPLDARSVGSDRTAEERVADTPATSFGGAMALLRKARRLQRLARRLGASAVVTFLQKSHVIAMTARLLSRGRLPVVINVHEQMRDHLRHHYAGAARVLMAAFVRHAFPRADRLVAVAEGVERDLVGGFSIPEERITVMRNPIDVPSIRTAAAESVTWPAGGTAGARLVAVGRLHPLKGIDRLLRAFARLPKELGASLVVVGDGPDRARLEELRTELGLAGRVALVGHDENPWRWMAAADVFVLSSLTEAAPTVLGEALALGLPVVATACSPGVREFLEPGPCGVLAAPDDAADLYRKIRRVLEDGGLRGALRQNAEVRGDVLARATPIHDYEELLMQVLARPRPGTPPPGPPSGRSIEGVRRSGLRAAPEWT